MAEHLHTMVIMNDVKVTKTHFYGVKADNEAKVPPLQLLRNGVANFGRGTASCHDVVTTAFRR